MAKSKYEKYTKEQLIEKIKQLEKHRYGLVWEDKQEDVAEQCNKELPVLHEDTSREIKSTSTDKRPVNILIEGDNYHALYALSFTHRRKVDVVCIDPPYNTGAKDWKYNNNYVDEIDPYRHSKWLSMMYKRLRLARNLLKQNGVLIVTIDDHELFGLLGLLENLKAKSLGRVCICIKPEGRRQSKYVMEAHEYALFVTWGNPVMRGLNVDFGLDFPEEDTESKFRWEGLMRRDAPREDRGSDYWYPFYVFPDGTLSVESAQGANPVWPINTKSIERVWLWDKERAASNIAELRAVVRKGKSTIYYKRREQGRVKPTSFWYGSKYNANAYGTRLVTSILPENDFDYPKSLYSVLDCIDLFLPKDGLALDFFAGSGTTGHAVLELNEQDGGNRQFILCTNNENGICEEVCYPRINKVIKGYNNNKPIPANLKYYKTEFVPQVITDNDKRVLVNRSTELLCLAENTYELVKQSKRKLEFAIYKSLKQYTAVIYDEDAIEKCKEELKALKPKVKTVIYVFSYDHEYNAEDFEDLTIRFDVKPIPEAILNVYRKNSRLRRK